MVNSKNQKNIKTPVQKKTTAAKTQNLSRSVRLHDKKVKISDDVPLKTSKGSKQQIQIPSLAAMKKYSSKASKLPPPAKKIQQPTPVKPAVLKKNKEDDFGSTELPSSYNQPTLTLLVKDPYWVFAFWEIPQVVLNRYQSLFRRGGKMVLRIYDVSSVDFNGNNAHYSFDVETGSAQSWYVNLWKDQLSLVAELGVKSSDGKFTPFIRSNTVQTPRAGVSQRKEQIWVEIKEKAGAPYLSLQAKRKQSKPGVPSKRKIYLSNEDIRRFYSDLTPAMMKLLNDRLHDLVQQDGFSIDETYLHFTELIRSRPVGASEWLPWMQLTGAGSGHLGSQAVSSFGQRAEQRKFFFELNADVKVYGRTEPDAEVWLNQEKISLNPDGTFTLRFALPDISIPLAFKAIASDQKEERTVETNINRQSTYKIPVFSTPKAVR